MVVVQIIVVELHYYILVIGWYFSIKNEWIPRVDVYYAPSTRDGYVLMVVHCSRIYKEVLC